jgi:N-acetylneuraminic acid mutarotase
MSILPAGAELGARRNATALWTGSELIVWGGENDGRYLRGGARFDPVINAWTALSVTNTPAARTDHTAVWTGTEMLVWGGYNGQALSSGGRFNPALNSWSAMTTNGAPTARRAHTAVWTGDKMIVWGGYIKEGHQNTFLATGGGYVPSQDRWTQISTNSVPVARAGHTAIWTGTEMLVWGGYFESGSNKPPVINYLRSGASYRPDLDFGPLSQPWLPLPTKGAPLSARCAHTALWTGTEMIVWGGSDRAPLNTGARYLPSSGTWTALTTTDAPAARYDHTAVWTGIHMLIWGGRAGATELNTGARYHPASGRWWPITTASAPGARYDHSAVWTGTEMLIWGGYDGAVCLDTINGYTPAVTLYLYLKP